MFQIERAGKVDQPLKPKRIEWPWRNMQPGDVVKINDANLAAKAQVNCHVYGRTTGMIFKTKTIDGVLHVKRIE